MGNKKKETDTDKMKPKNSKAANKARIRLAALRTDATDAEFVDFNFLKEFPVLLTAIEPLHVNFNAIGVITQPVDCLSCTVIDNNTVEMWTIKRTEQWGDKTDSRVGQALMLVYSRCRDDLSDLCDTGTYVYSATAVFVSSEQALATVPDALAYIQEKKNEDEDPGDFVALCSMPQVAPHMPSPATGDYLVTPADGDYADQWFGSRTDFCAYELLHTTVQDRRVVVLPPQARLLETESEVSYETPLTRSAVWLNSDFQVSNPANGTVESAQHMVYLRPTHSSAPGLDVGHEGDDEGSGLASQFRGNPNAPATVTSSQADPTPDFLPTGDPLIATADIHQQMPSSTTNPAPGTSQSSGSAINLQFPEGGPPPPAPDTPAYSAEVKRKAKEFLIPEMQKGYDALSAHAGILYRGYGKIHKALSAAAEDVHKLERDRVVKFTGSLKDALTTWSDSVADVQNTLGTPNIATFNSAVTAVRGHTKTLRDALGEAAKAYADKNTQTAIADAYAKLPEQLDALATAEVDALCDKYIDKTTDKIFDSMWNKGVALAPFVCQAAGFASQLKLAVTALTWDMSRRDRQLEHCLTGINRVMYSMAKSFPAFTGLSIPALDHSPMPVAVPSTIPSSTENRAGPVSKISASMAPPSPVTSPLATMPSMTAASTAPLAPSLPPVRQMGTVNPLPTTMDFSQGAVYSPTRRNIKYTARKLRPTLPSSKKKQSGLMRSATPVRDNQAPRILPVGTLPTLPMKGEPSSDCFIVGDIDTPPRQHPVPKAPKRKHEEDDPGVISDGIEVLEDREESEVSDALEDQRAPVAPGNPKKAKVKRDEATLAKGRTMAYGYDSSRVRDFRQETGLPLDSVNGNNYSALIKRLCADPALNARYMIKECAETISKLKASRQDHFIRDAKAIDLMCTNNALPQCRALKGTPFVFMKRYALCFIRPAIGRMKNKSEKERVITPEDADGYGNTEMLGLYSIHKHEALKRRYASSDISGGKAIETRYCPLCRYDTTSSDSLNNHIRSHYEMGLRCGFLGCEFMAVSAEKMWKHGKEVHGIRTTDPINKGKKSTGD